MFQLDTWCYSGKLGPFYATDISSPSVHPCPNELPANSCPKRPECDRVSSYSDTNYVHSTKSSLCASAAGLSRVDSYWLDWSTCQRRVTAGAWEPGDSGRWKLMLDVHRTTTQCQHQCLLSLEGCVRCVVLKGATSTGHPLIKLFIIICLRVRFQRSYRSDDGPWPRWRCFGWETTRMVHTLLHSSTTSYPPTSLCKEMDDLLSGGYSCG